jgi:hypothetical protein
MLCNTLAEIVPGNIISSVFWMFLGMLQVHESKRYNYKQAIDKLWQILLFFIDFLRNECKNYAK